MEYQIWPDMPNVPPGPPPLPEQRHVPQFSGDAKEYFGIWIVNVLLSIVTLGIYSAWAKVRTERYFYANTRLAGSNFEYTANPIAILKGRLIAYAVVITLAVSSKLMPLLYIGLILLVGVLMPALIVLSLRFRARNSVWRGLSFRFDQPVGDAYLPFFLWQILTSMTMGLLYPVAKVKQQEFVVEGHRFGVKRFSFRGEAGQYYPPFLIVLGLGVLGFIGWMVMFIGIGAASGMFEEGANAGGKPPAEAMAMIMGVMAVFYLGVFTAMAFLRVKYTNLMWRNTTLGPHRFESTLRFRDVLWIYASNIVAIVCTIGLATPWAMVRLARYRAQHFALVSMGDLDAFFAASEMRSGAAGYELVDALDTGIDFGI